MEIDTVHRYPSYFLKDKVDKQLHCLQSQGIIPSIQFSDRTAQIVPVIKSNSNNHICGDYEITKKLVPKQDIYPLPRVEDLFSHLSRGMVLTKLDLTCAYQQIELDEVLKSTLPSTNLKVSFNSRYYSLVFLLHHQYSKNYGKPY